MAARINDSYLKTSNFSSLKNTQLKNYTYGVLAGKRRYDFDHDLQNTVNMPVSPRGVTLDFGLGMQMRIKAKIKNDQFLKAHRILGSLTDQTNHLLRC